MPDLARFLIAMAKYYKIITIVVLFSCLKTTWAQNTCMISEYIKPGQTLTINSPLYPRKYRAGTECTWFFSTSPQYELRLNCPIVDMPKLRTLPSVKTIKKQVETPRAKFSEPIGSFIKEIEQRFRNLQWDSWVRSYSNWEMDNIPSFMNAIPEENQNGSNCTDYLTVNTSRQDNAYCQPFNINGSIIKIDLSSSKWGQGGLFSCNITAYKKSSSQPKENCQCGWTFTTRSRIVGGRDAEMNEFPSIAAVKYKETRNPICSATIIAPRAAISAAHCYHRDRNVNNYQLVVGEHDTSRKDETNAEKFMEISKIIIHGAYRRSLYWNDIALLITKDEIQYSPKVGPACLPYNIPKEDILGEHLTVAGWGRLEFQGKQPEILQTVQLEVVEDSLCNDHYNQYYFMYNSSQQICTYYPGKDACRGDSGGPLYYTDPETNVSTIVAIVSYAEECGSSAPAVNVDVHKYLPWIIEKLSPDMQLCGKSNWKNNR